MNYFLHLKSYFRKIIKLSVLENAVLLRCSSEIRRLGHFHSVLGELGELCTAGSCALHSGPVLKLEGTPVRGQLSFSSTVELPLSPLLPQCPE